MDFYALLGKLDGAQIALICMVLIVILTVVSWHRNKDGFDLSTCITDTVTGKVSPEKIGYMTVLAMMSWGFAALVLRNQMTEMYAGMYAGVFVLGRIGYKYADTKKEAANVADAPK
jgi:polyferredoxin